MPLPDRFCIDIPETVPVYSYDDTYTSAVSYRYPCESNIIYRYPCYSTVSYYHPSEVVIRNDDTRSETAAIRHDLNQIKNDLKKIKQQQTPPTYYAIKQVSSDDECPVCHSSTSQRQSKQKPDVVMYYCERCRSFIEKPTYSVATKLRPKTPNTTYQDSYRLPYPLVYEHMSRRVTLNELQSEAPPETKPVQHPRPWIPPGYKNRYPYRQFNLSAPHSEP